MKIKPYQVAIISFALGIFIVTFIGAYLINRFKTEEREVYIEETPILKEYDSILVFFSNNIQDPITLNCDKTYPAERAINRISDDPRITIGELAYLALSELLKGPGEHEKSQGFFTSINDGVKIQTITIKDGIAEVDFNEKLNENVAGSCRVMAIRSQITETLLQFSGIKSVVIYVNGRSEDILQP